MGLAVLLFVVGFGALAGGILIGRYYVPDDRALRRTARHSHAYIRALNSALARDADTAIAELKTAVKEDVSDVEPYFALGALFRSRGEWERAIRVHQALGMRGDADRELRLRARYELGLDFRAAGMPRRATRAMEECLADDDRHDGALRALASLYEEQGRYAEAAAAWRRLDSAAEGGVREQHLLAAAAQLALQRMELDEARRLVREAQRVGTDNPHVHLAAALLATADEDPVATAERLRDGLIAAPDLAAFWVPLIEEAHRAIAERRPSARPAAELPPGGDEPPAEPAAAEPSAGEPPPADALTLAVLDSAIAEVGREPNLVLATARLRAAAEPERAFAEIRALADEHPDLLAVRVAAARLALAGEQGSGDAATIGAELAALVDADGALATMIDGAWRCAACGYRADALFWRCPSCRHWGAVRADLGARAEPPPPLRDRERRLAPRPLPPAIDTAFAPRESRPPPSAIGRAQEAVSDLWRAIRGRRDD